MRSQAIAVLRPSWGPLLALAASSCSGSSDLGLPLATTGPDPGPEFPECRTESYDFAGEGTLAGLGLDKATPVPPPNPNRPAMIWVTHDLKPSDPGPADGPIEMTRMMCFRFADGSGGSEWPVDPTWQPPGRNADESWSGSTNALSLAVAVLATGAVIGVSVVAFKRRPDDLS